MAGDIQRANREIIQHNIEMRKEGKGRYQAAQQNSEKLGPKRKGRPTCGKKCQKKKKGQNQKNKNKNKLQ